MDWLASIGGIERVMLKFIALFFGGYIKFTCDIEVMKMLQLHCDIPVCYRVYIYILTKLCLLDICIRHGNRRLEHYKGDIIEGKKSIENIFNLRGIFNNVKQQALKNKTEEES